jgi:hypothetical protein
LLLVLGGAIYWGVLFGPHYWRRLKVREVLRTATVEYYHVRKSGAKGRELEQRKSDIERQVREKLLGLGVAVLDDGYSLDLVSETKVEARVRYEVAVRHPVIGKTTVLHFTDKAQADVTPMQWE